MFVDRGLVREEHVLVEPVCDAHDIDVAKLGPTLAPIRVRHDVMAPHFAARLDLATDRDLPMKERVIARDAFVARRRLDVFEERREAADDAAFRKRLRNGIELIDRDACFTRTRLPKVRHEFVCFEFALERDEHAPVTLREFDDIRVDRIGEHVRARAELHAAPPNVAHAEREELLRWHQAKCVRADVLAQEFGMLRNRVALRHLERRPEAILRSRRGGVRGADHDVP